MEDQAQTFVYPSLGSWIDVWFVRVSGSGLGNAFYSYFHAVALADQGKATIIVPPWFSVKIGPMLRGQSGKRFYLGMFKPYRGEIRGLRKLWVLLSRYRKRKIVEVDGARPAALASGMLNIVTVNNNFTFEGLYPHRDAIRQRILDMVNDPLPPGHCWGRGKFIAVHVRMGEFAQVSDTKLITGGQSNVRIPLSWYAGLVKKLRACYPQMPVLIFSDGKEQELTPLLESGATPYRSGSDMTDLLAMSSASILVGSNSTYSRWAAFLGDMPSIWIKREIQEEKPSSPETPILYVPIDNTDPVLWPDPP
jgi:Glycosyl transferase family 11